MRFQKYARRSDDGCWIWSGYRDRKGYGRLLVDGQPERSHRLSYRLHKGEIPDGLCVCHTCDNRACVNPDHLFLGTSADNVADRVAKGRSATGDKHGARTRPERMPRGDNHYARRNPQVMKRGEENGRAKLSTADVIAIRLGGESARAAGRRLGVSKTTVLKIRRSILWAHIT